MMRLSQNSLGWGLVAFSAAMLGLLVIGRWQYPVLPRGELALLAQAQVEQFIFEGEITHTQSVIMSQDEFNAMNRAYPAMDATYDGQLPVYVYRAYGKIKQALILGGFESPPDYYYQALEVALDARTGKWLGNVSAIPHDTIPYDLKIIPTVDPNPPHFLPPTIAPSPVKATAIPEITTEAMP